MIALLAILLTAPAATFEGTVQTASPGAPSSIAARSSVRMDGDLYLSGQPYPVWFEAQNGPLHTWWFGAPGRPDVHRGWISQSGERFDGVYGDYPGWYWKFSGPTHAPEPTAGLLFGLGALLVNRRRRR